MNNYSKQPLIYVATESQYNAIGLELADKNSSAAFIAGPQRKITTHNTDFFCGTRDVEERFDNINTRITDITNILNRLGNIDGQDGDNTLAGRVARLEGLMDQLFPMDGDDENGRADFIDQLWQAIQALQTANNQIITTINNNLADIDFWYTYEE